jgi:hypothetical protein
MAKNLSLQDIQSSIEKLSLDEQLQLQANLQVIIDTKGKLAAEVLDKIEKAKK